MGSGSIHHALLSSELHWGERLASRPSRFTPGESDFGTHPKGCRVDLKEGLDAVAQRNHLTFKEYPVSGWYLA
jgi:hypothetical protein